MDHRLPEQSAGDDASSLFDRLLLVQARSLQLIDSARGVVQQKFAGTGQKVAASNGVTHGDASFIGAAVAAVGAVPRYIAAAQQHKALVAFWDLQKEVIAYQAATPEHMSTLAFHPSGSLLFAGSKSGCLYCWQLNGVLPLPNDALCPRASEGASLLRRCWPAHYGECAALLVQDDRVTSAGVDGSIKQISLYE
ncbi:WD domain, G-beta repeat-containing protein [Besnoitia besnoiti]|uniref:WD domain, G-beta repeat-containing protein n=1 Tax=Besnoitia besnoiti TaxID=94643 RepID=A0A2A9MCF0_BESBE|nr:WD domain, G-beta repeat-containing protein [Besnoitia besnoiti]PFH33070.1 WD domain, G-beta repeat-containing protein [Besnoitia besnoiti]